MFSPAGEYEFISAHACALCGFPKPYFENIKKSPGF